MFVLAALSLLGHAVASSSPTPTAPTVYHGRLPPPDITAAPDLFRRQQTVLATCGFVDGDANQPKVCSTGSFCASSSTFAGCCSSSACIIRTTCYDGVGNTACGSDCQANPRNLVCPSYCATYNYTGASTAYLCFDTPGWSHMIYDTATNGLATISSASSISFNSQDSTITPSTESASTVASSTSSGSSSGSSTASSASQSSTGSASSSSSSTLSVGAIVGIVIGAIIALAIAAGAAFYFGRRSSKNKNQGPGPDSAYQSAVHKNDPRYSAVPQIQEVPGNSPQPYYGYGQGHYQPPQEMPATSRAG